MAFAGAVYTVQTNWKTKSDQAQSQVGKVQTDLNNVQAEFNQYKSDAQSKVQQATDESNRVKGLNAGLEQQVATLTTQLNTTKTEASTQRDQAIIASQEAKDRYNEAIEQRKINTNLHESTNDLITRLRVAEDKNFNLAVEMNQIREKQSTLLADFADAKRILRDAGLDLNTRTAATSKAPPPLVVGLVLETKKTDRTGNELVEISVGSDDGLLEGHSLYVYRTGLIGGDRARYLGKIQLLHVTPDRAVGSIVERAKNGVIEKGDNVSTQL
jgi:hypothetical protein